MVLKNVAFKQLADYVKQNKLNIVIFGTGVLGRVTAVEILKEYGIEGRIECYIDNDKHKQTSKDVYPASKLEEYDETQIVILLAVSRCGSILEQLESYPNLKNVHCYMLPMMCISNFKNTKKIDVQRESDYPKIPKVIHYMWLGKKEVPSYLQKCIDSWQKYCPDYEIKRWDETNYDIEKNEYMKEAYKAGMYGFVPDYARLDILNSYGGIYMDTDVELIRGLDDLLYQDAFCGIEKWQTLNLGGCSGAVKGSVAIKKMLEDRRNIYFVDSKGIRNMNTCGYYDTLSVIKCGYRINGKRQKILDMNIYPYDFFHPYDYMSGQLDITENTYAIHHFNGGWLDEDMKLENEKIQSEYRRIEGLSRN